MKEKGREKGGWEEGGGRRAGEQRRGVGRVGGRTIQRVDAFVDAMGAIGAHAAKPAGGAR